VESGASAVEPVSFGELLGNKGVLIGCTLFLLQQFSGINAIVYFSSSVFAQVPDPHFPFSGESAAESVHALPMSLVAAGLLPYKDYLQ
jgi:hypothetical protein